MIFRASLIALASLVASIPAAESQTVPAEIGEKTLQTLKALAWQSLPTKIVQSDRKILEIDKSDPSKIVVPDDEARAVIEAARLTARAQKCGLQDLVIANRDALLLRMRRTGKWNESQLLYVNALHLFTVQLLAGKIEPEMEKPETEKPVTAAGETAPAPRAENMGCSEEEKQDISAAVEANEKLPGKS
ncbi:MAG: hypothetical protein ACLPPF_23665 [Rhodomicrobium sp.]